MGTMRLKVYREVLRGRNTLKTTSNAQFLKQSGLVTLKKEYQHSCRIDPESLLPYRTTRVYVHRGRIVSDYILVSSEEAQNIATKKKRSVEIMHAMDVVLFTLVSNPWLQAPS